MQLLNRAKKLDINEIQFSVIIPTLNEANHLPEALASLPENRKHIECIVADGGSTDATQDAVDLQSQLQWLECPERGRAAQMNLAAQVAIGDVLVFLHADVQLPENAFKLIHDELIHTEIVGGGFCLRYPRKHWMLKLCELGSLINHPLMTYGDQVLFIRRKAFEKVGGYQNWPLMEDLEIQFRLRKLGKLIKLKTPVVSSDRRFTRNGPVRHQLLNIGLVLLFLCGISPQRLAKWYQ